MADRSPLPWRPSVETDADPRVLTLEDEAADRVLSALSAETAREIYLALRADPATPPELADTLDVTLQNTHYHLGTLEDAGLVESAGTAYSEKGVEMTVFAPTDRPLVVTTGGESLRSRLRAFLGRVLGGVVLLAVASGLVEVGLGRRGATAPPAGNMTAPPVGPGTAGVPPGLLFFAGGVAGILAVAALWGVRHAWTP